MTMEKEKDFYIDRHLNYEMKHIAEEWEQTMKKEKPIDPFERALFVADFETTVDEDLESKRAKLIRKIKSLGESKIQRRTKLKRRLDELVGKVEKISVKIKEQQTQTEVWSAAICPVLKRPEPEDVLVYDNIYEFIDHLSALPDHSIVFFHNLSFDGSYILDELNLEGFLPAMSSYNPDHYASNKEMRTQDFTYKVCISQMNQWYSITINFEDGRTIEIWDSAKKIPSKLRGIGKDFNTKYKKLTMEYEGKRQKFGRISDEEMAYIKNDVLVLSEAMYTVWYEYKMTKMTIAGDALASYRELIGEEQYKEWFPDLLAINLPCGMSAYEYCQKGYAGGWCYLNPYMREKVFLSDDKFSKYVKNPVHVKNIIVADVNSLYPSMMSSMSGNEYPIGKPEYHIGEPNKYEEKMFCIYRRFKCRFNIKEGYLPFIHIRGDRRYRANECQLTTDIFGERYDKDGNDTVREFVMTQVEWELFKEHYNITDYEALDYLAFDKEKGIFDAYIEKYKKMKIDATKEGNKAKRTIAKLFLNSLYGKLSSSTNSSYKTVYFEDDDILRFETHIEYTKQPISISAGAYITAYARNFTIRACQQNYFEGEDRGFAYADTDSAHMVDYDADDVKGMKFDSAEFCCWDVEVSKCAVATYVKQKTYMEFATEESFKKVLDKKGNESYNIIMKAAGLSDKGKKTFKKALLSPSSKIFVDDFRRGFEMKGCNLKKKQIKGGALLCKDDFKLR